MWIFSSGFSRPDFLCQGVDFLDTQPLVVNGEHGRENGIFSSKDEVVDICRVLCAQLVDISGQ